MGTTPAYDRLEAYLRARDAAEPGVAEEMRSQIVRGTPGGGAVVLLHGLTASPPAWRAVTEALVARGRTVVVPRLLLHGQADRMTTALRGLRAQALIDDVAAIVRATAELGEPLTIAGHSLGATLALDAATTGPAQARVVAVAPFLGLPGVPHEFHPLLFRLLARVPDAFLWWNPLLRERLEPAHGYPRYPLAALEAGLRIADRARAGGPPAVRAIDFVINAAETSVSNRTAQRLAGAWRRAGASVAVHRLRGLTWSHDIIEPVRRPSQRAFATLLEILESDHAPADREHRVGGA
ncbi:MAG: alpha/beta fold hydrolase [Candidatus Lustribacter sp.]